MWCGSWNNSIAPYSTHKTSKSTEQNGKQTPPPSPPRYPHYCSLLRALILVYLMLFSNNNNNGDGIISSLLPDSIASQNVRMEWMASFARITANIYLQRIAGGAETSSNKRFNAMQDSYLYLVNTWCVYRIAFPQPATTTTAAMTIAILFTNLEKSCSNCNCYR